MIYPRSSSIILRNKYNDVRMIQKKTFSIVKDFRKIIIEGDTHIITSCIITD